MDIKREIAEYINAKETNGALLVTGDWGSGKTYVIKEIVKDLNKGSELAVAIVSLFGIDSITALNERVKSEYLECYSGFFRKAAVKAYKSAAKLAKTGSKVVSSAMPESAVASAISTGISSVDSFSPLKIFAVKNTVGAGEKKRQFAIVFDDFERCKIEKIDLLGAINEYVENREIKTVLVADESKINDERYSEFKEKLITRTLKLQPEFTIIIDSIIEKYKGTYKGYKDFLIKNKDTIQQVFVESGSNNLRSLKCFLIDFERVFATWNESSISKDHIKPIFYMFGALTFGVKDGKYKEGEYGFLYSDKEISSLHSDWDSRYILTSLRNWIVEGLWDEKSFVEELSGLFEKRDLTDEQSFLAYSFWDLEQRYITTGMPIAVRKANDGELTRNELIDLLKKISALKKYSIPLPCEVDYAKMEAGFALRKQRILAGEIQEPRCNRFVESGSIEEASLPLYQSIQKFEDERLLYMNKEEFYKYLKRETKKSEYSFRGLPIGALDRDLAEFFLSVYYESENYLRRDMAMVLLYLAYTGNSFVTAEHRKITLENMTYLIEKLDEHSAGIKDDYIAVATNNSFVMHLRETIEEIKKYDAPGE